MLIGYARVSTEEQNLALQFDALRQAGCQQVFCDEGISGATTERPALNEALAALGERDVLVVWKLDRLGRSLAHLIQITARLEATVLAFVLYLKPSTRRRRAADFSFMSWALSSSLNVVSSASAHAREWRPPRHAANILGSSQKKM